METIVQCDFDGTITHKDVSFMILDAFADADWRRLLNEYREGRISGRTFNAKTFTRVKTDKQTLLDFIFTRGRVEIRTGFGELLDCCSKNGFKFVIVSNGLGFYIEAILRDLGIEGIEVFAAQTRFSPDGLQVKYTGPDGNQLESGLKDAYTELFLKRGYRVVYVGNGSSDCSPARQSHYVFAADILLAYCQEMKLKCTPFTDLSDIARGLELLAQE